MELHVAFHAASGQPQNVVETVGSRHDRPVSEELAEETSSSGKSISDLLIDIRSLVGETVSATTEEMSAGMEELAASIADVSDISHRTSNEAELMATGTAEQLVSAEKIQISAEELRDMSQQLQNDLSKFVLCNDV
ncbi:hypothetical protein [Paenibacillus alvei]|uniref:Methyl-accepting chemotaxis sensory transducer n=1 Tax=Paenibacillus alvei TaxID=44250 RepID=A0A383RJM5_PAEAL